MPVCSPHTRDSAKSAVRARRPEPWAAVANCSGHRLKTPLTSSNRPAAPAKDPIASRPVSVPYAPAPVPPQYRAHQKLQELPRKTGGSRGVLVCPVLWARWGGGVPGRRCANRICLHNDQVVGKPARAPRLGVGQCIPDIGHHYERNGLHGQSGCVWIRIATAHSR